MNSINISFDAREYTFEGGDFYRVSLKIEGLFFTEKRLERVGNGFGSVISNIFELEKIVGKMGRQVPLGAEFIILTREIVKEEMMRKFKSEIQQFIKDKGL